MNDWKPILEGPQKDNVLQLLDNIGVTISENYYSEEIAGLSEGLAGQILFLSHYGRVYDLEEKVKYLLEKVDNDRHLNCSVMGGLAGIGFVLKIIESRHQILSTTLFDQLFNYVEKLTWIAVSRSDYDFLNGYLGACFFLLESTEKGDYLPLIEAVVGNIKKNSINYSNGIGWVSDKERLIHYPGIPKSEVPVFVNLGTAHGSPGIAVQLSLLHKHYPNFQLDKLVNKIVMTLQEEAKGIKDGFHFPFFSGEMGNQFDRHLGWCYCDLGISAALLHLYRIQKDPAILDFATKLALKCTLKRIEDTPNMGSGLCHGAAGVAHIFNKFYQETRNTVFRDAAVYWFNILTTVFIKTNKNGKSEFQTRDLKNGGLIFLKSNGYLEGLSGIGLALHAAIHSELPLWDRMLGI